MNKSTSKTYCMLEAEREMGNAGEVLVVLDRVARKVPSKKVTLA